MNDTLKGYAIERSIFKIPMHELFTIQNGLKLLGECVTNAFFDIPILPTRDRFAEDGLFYAVPHLHNNVLSKKGTEYSLVVVWEIKNQSSHCPYRFTFEYIDESHYSIYLYDQSTNRTKKYILVEQDGITRSDGILEERTITLSTIRTILANV